MRRDNMTREWERGEQYPLSFKWGSFHSFYYYYFSEVRDDNRRAVKEVCYGRKYRGGEGDIKQWVSKLESVSQTHNR